MRIVCWQTIIMNIISYIFRKLRKMSQNLSSAAVVIGALSKPTGGRGEGTLIFSYIRRLRSFFGVQNF